ADVDPRLLDLLRLGSYQLLHTRIPAHAAVATTVDLARAIVGAGPARYANAVLRQVSARDWAGWLDELAPDPGSRRLALEHGYPHWIVDAFSDALGPEHQSELDSALRAAGATPAVTLVARPGRIRREELVAQAGPGAQPTPYSPYGVALPGGDPARLAAIRSHAAAVQDEGSQLVALAFAAARLDGTDRRWLDAAAGPGGKAALLAGLAEPRRAVLLAADIAHHRARLLRRTLGGGAVVQTDTRRGPWPPASFDRVLLDAPCSGLGALRRRPDARWRRGPADIARLAGLQRELLLAAMRATRPGGLVCYATCSPHLAETRAVVFAVRKIFDAVTPVDVRKYLPGLPDLGEGPDVQLWPHRHGTDAMYLAMLTVRGS
ncbi:MAG: RsmB/NOP family class I SAM-dependent RNA methyltransferase, partial [Mycobacteriales bacterium]